MKTTKRQRERLEKLLTDEQELPPHIEEDLADTALISDKRFMDMDRDQRTILATDAIFLAREVIRLRKRLGE